MPTYGPQFDFTDVGNRSDPTGYVKAMNKQMRRNYQTVADEGIYDEDEDIFI